MGNISLYALTQGGTGYASYVQLDLYTDEPIKLTKSIQELETPQATTSAFTKTFRIPNTSTNGQFMKAVFNVNSVDFNATQKARSYINVNDAYFTSGNIRLVSVHETASKTKIEYEVIFMGETSTFASEVGVKTLASLSGLGLIHEKNYANIVRSWAGNLKEGNILYPLCEWGYTYDSATDLPNESTLSVYNPSGTNLAVKGFTNPLFPLSQDQFKPFIRTKWIWDSIFTEAGFTYTSNFLESDFFKSLYSILSSVDTSGGTYIATNTFRAGFSANQAQVLQDFSTFSRQVPIVATTVFVDTTNNYSTAGNGFFTSPEDGFYTFSVDRMLVNYTIRPFPYKPGSPGNIYAQNFVISLRWRDEFGVAQEQDAQAWLNTDPNNVDRNKVYNAQDFLTPVLFWSSIYLQKGATISIWAEIPASQFTRFEIIRGQWSGNTTTQSVPQGMLPEQFKQLEFIKGINDRFKLMWEPDEQNPNNFYIEPWVDWVRGGVRRDWTDKLNTNFEMKTQPLFYTQARQYNFKDSSDTDLYNFSYEQKNKQTFGQLNQDSGIELITGTKVITSIFSPFPLGPIPGDDSFLIPHFAKDTETQRQPIQIKPRLCFYNGTGPSPTTWYLENDAGTAIAQPSYPIVSSFSRYPFDSNATDLSWVNVAQFWDEQATGFSGRTVSSAYNNYWKSWFDTTFDPYSRKMTATFALDSPDITELRFNDKIFIRDSWWLPVKITDYEIGTKQNVKVDLIKLGAVGVSFFDIETPETQLFKQEGVCFGTTLCEACCCTGLFTSTLYTPTSDFISSTYFQDPTGTTPALQGWYSNGLGFSVFVNSDGIGVLLSSCDECNCDQEGLTEFNDVCSGPSLCQACCCTGTVFPAIYGNGAVFASSTSLFAGPLGGPLPPGTWFSDGSGSAVQVGPDGTTIVAGSSCVQCVCNELDPIGRLAQYYFPDNIQNACCIQGATGFQGVFNYWGTTGDFAGVTGIFLDVAGVFPAGSTAGGETGPVYLSQGEFVKTVLNGSVSASAPCTFAVPCPGRNQSVDFNSTNLTATDATLGYAYTISYDGLTYYSTGNSQSTGPSFSDTTSIFYDPSSLIQVTATASGASPLGKLNWAILVGGVTGATGYFIQPGSVTTPPQLCGTGGVEFNFTYTI